ncbi:autotransporter outer membrane beta-barrel domain-containing protein [Sandaracinobacter neustonicus]|uniref:Autotransporter outer membrane beta-barrel domain-containing protein n=1 Tax=Sandaracinobacter neustonicus TaxID=1715348 RepID=A0A501XYI5_9SPHN|nr:autotransporter outer membrane beta-barrel domain-containing protein [Sandaracinobacter neustonicus]TPE65074.1 autotransporter outer membrane beta-barrel domain-containing protein [Sandaracinobacter neustonicus]
MTATETDLTLVIRRKTSSEVGLTSAAASGYDAILTAALTDDVISQSFLDIMDGDTLQTLIAQMLPDHSGAVFDAVTRGTRLVSRHVMDRDSEFSTTETGDMGFWLEPVYWRSNRHATGTNSYKSSGWGLSGGFEWVTDIGYIGGSYAFLASSINNNGGTGKINASQHDIGAFWRTGREGPFYAYARLGAAHGSFSGSRTVDGTADDSDFSYSTSGKWKGWLVSGMGGASYDIEPSERFTIRPKLGLEWFRLSETGYTESGGGEAIDLTVGRRNSSALSASTTLALSYVIGPPRKDYHGLAFELEGGRRSVLAGGLGSTRANFEDGETFTINPDGLDSSWLGEARVKGGSWDYSWKVGIGADKTRNSDVNYSARVSVSIAIY